LINAVAIGHNLTHGSAEFTRKKVSDANAVTSVEALEEEEVKKEK
jgi:hypothetical protein